jgi:hypothetical protein
MKKLLTILITLFLTSPALFAQQPLTQAPPEVELTFEQKFTDVRDIKWRLDADSYIALFQKDGVEYNVTFGEGGAWHETKHQIALEDIPSEIKEILANKYPDFLLTEAEIVETEKGINFELILEAGKYELAVLMSRDGEIISQKKSLKEQEKEERD